MNFPNFYNEAEIFLLLKWKDRVFYFQYIPTAELEERRENHALTELKLGIEQALRKVGEALNSIIKVGKKLENIEKY
jgi:hypothetical protein